MAWFLVRWRRCSSVIGPTQLSRRAYPANELPAPIRNNLSGSRTSPIDRPWKPEREVDELLAKKLIGAHFEELDVRALEPMTAGWDNTVFVADTARGDIVFRFPRRKIAVELIEAEVRVLTKLADSELDLGLAIPNPEFVAPPSSEFPWPFCGYPLLPGTTADRAKLSADERASCAEPLAQFFAALHGLGGAGARRLGANRDLFGRLDSKGTERIRERLEYLKSRGLGREHEALAALAEPDVAVTQRLPRGLCHGDFYARHLLIDGDRQAFGVIDWGDVHVGPVAVDLGFVFTLFGDEGRSRFLASYGELDPATRALALFRALMSAATITAFGDDTNDEALVAEGLFGLEQLAGQL